MNFPIRINVQNFLKPAVVFVLFYVSLISAVDFGYEGRNGPEHWSEDFKKCNGKHQSPINIDLLEVVPMVYPKIEYINFDATPKSSHVQNNGHTIMVTMSFEEGKEPRIRGGPLALSETEYQFEQFHFHWGENNSVGSEALLNDQSYPAEMHLVMRSLKYPNFTSALGQENGVVIFAFFFKAKDIWRNINYQEILDTISIINRQGKSSDLINRIPLWNYMSGDLIHYLSYEGSLTTPPCEEKVIWIDFTQPIEISHEQLNRFRTLLVNNKYLRNNFRPIQPINDRIVHQNVPDLNSPQVSISSPYGANAASCKGTTAILFALYSVMSSVYGNF